MKKKLGNFTVIIDKDKNLKYETNSFFKKIINLLFIPVLNSLPKSFKRLIEKSNKSAGEVIRNKTTYYALEVLYNNGTRLNFRTYLENFFYKIWFQTNNAKGVRNRLKKTKREIKINLLSILENKEKVRFLSIASGSARGIIEVLNELDYELQSKIEVVFLDKSIHALEYSKKLVNLKGLEKRVHFSWVNDTAGSYLRSLGEDKKFDLIEMVGLLDYFPNEKVLQIFNHIFSVLHDDGVLITANINDNRERRFVTNIIDWKMIYRSGEEMMLLLKNSGFCKKNIISYYEPLMIHSILIAKK